MTRIRNLSRHTRVVFAITLAALVGAGVVAGPVAATVTGGITVYETKTVVHGTFTLGKVTIEAKKVVPAGQYLVNATIEVNTESPNTVICSLGTSATTLASLEMINHNTSGVTSSTNPATMSENHVVTIATGQTLYLNCADTQTTATDGVSWVFMDATPVNSLH